MKHFILTLIFTFLTTILIAQVARESDEKVISDLMERLIETNETVYDFTDLQEQLEQYNKNKLNLNTATLEQLQRLFFLDDAQISAIISHRQRFGNFISLYELQTIVALDDQTIYYLTYFTTVDEIWQQNQTTFIQKIKKGKHEITALYDTDYEPRAGYNPTLKEQGKSYYMGNQERYVLRYRFSFSNQLSFGYAAETDQGEPFLWDNTTKGFDFHSIHFYYRPTKTIINTIALGDYQINIGQGLTFASGLAARKSAMVLNVRRSYLPIRPYRSLNETGFLRGAAVQLGKKKWQLLVFGSRKNLSTNYSNQDTTYEEGYFSSLDVTGLHRTATERSKSNEVIQNIAGANAQWKHSNGHIGITHVQTNYNVPFISGNAPYQLYNFSGKQLNNSGIDYKWQWRNMSLFGEFSFSSNNAQAFTSGLAISLDPKLDIMLLYRNFSVDYQTTYSNPFSEYNDSRNEKGIYSGISLRFNRKWALVSYADFYQSEWIRYLINAPSRGVDVLSELQYAPSRNAQLYLRARHETKTKNQSNITDKINTTSNESRTIFRFQAQYKLSLSLNLKSRIENITFTNEVNTPKNGTLIFQDLTWALPRKKLEITTRVAYFSIEDYNARIYATETDILYQYALPMYQNSGIRYYFVARYMVNRNLEFRIKVSQTTYSNVNEISGGLEKIEGNKLTDIRLQVRWLIN